MKKIILILLVLSPLLVKAEYNGVQIELRVQLIDGEELLGYKYIAHGRDNETYRKELEANPGILFINSFTFEPGEHGYYQKRLRYQYQSGFLYQLIEPVAIDLSKIQSVRITDMIISSYAIQIASQHQWEDKVWMNTEPIAKYSESEGMCIYDIFIHKHGAVSVEAIEALRLIIRQTAEKINIKEQALGGSIDSDEAYGQQMKPLYEERNKALKQLFEKHKHLKIVMVSLCTC